MEPAAWLATVVTAELWDGPQSGCTTTMVGSCVTTTCGTSGPKYDSAGTITITRAGSPFASMTYPGSNDRDSAEASSIAPGDVFTLQASGDTVPSFTITTEPTPPLATLTSPVAGDGGLLTIDATKDTTFTWTGGVAGNVVRVQLDAYPTSGAVSARCDFDATTGTGIVPSAALTGFPGHGRHSSRTRRTGNRAGGSSGARAPEPRRRRSGEAEARRAGSRTAHGSRSSHEAHGLGA